MKRIKNIALILGFMIFSITTYSNITLPQIFGDHMVLQQNSEVKFWGWGKPLEKVTVTLTWQTESLETVVDHNAYWSVTLLTPKAGGPHSIKIAGYNLVEIKDVLIGEVWLLGGQSNMEWTAGYGIDRGEELSKNANFEEIRFFAVSWKSSPYPMMDVGGKWVKCTPEEMKNFSAVGYFFGKEIHEKLKVPVGLISSNWGGTPIEVWIPEQNILSNPQLLTAANKIPFFIWAPTKPGVTFNSMIYPLMPFALKGVLWYQGESNVQNAYAYSDMLETMVRSWRSGFKKEFDFYFAQIAPYKDYAPEAGVQVRDQQRLALGKIQNSGMVVTSDIGNIHDIHPRNKLDVGKRFAHLALNKTYGLKEYAVSGPLFKNAVFSDKKVEILFDYSAGLYNKENEVKDFELAGEDLVWYPVKAQIMQDKVVLKNSKNVLPKYVRYAWSNTANPQLFNRDNLPASSFSTAPVVED